MPATFHFYLRKDKPNKQGLCPIYLRITHNRKMKYVNTGIKIKSSDWSQDKERVRRSHRTYNKLNEDLENALVDAQQVYRELNHIKRVSADGIKIRLQSNSKDNFFTLSDEYLEILESDKRYYTKKQAKVAIAKLKRFHGSEHLPLNLIDGEFLSKFQIYIKNGDGKKNKGNTGSTIHKNFEAIRAILDIAVGRHLIKENPARNGFVMVRKNKKEHKTKLSHDQIQRITDLELEVGTNMWHSRNIFILAFYFCGIRFGDAAMLCWKNVKNGRLRYEMGKTGIVINVEIPKAAEPFLTHYDHKGKSMNDFIFPFLSDLNKEHRQDPAMLRKRIGTWNAIVNDKLKEVAKQAEIDEKISMHVARHSFAQYGIMKGVSVYKMMMLLGHQNIKTTQEYLKTIDVKVVDDTMNEIFK